MVEVNTVCSDRKPFSRSLDVSRLRNCGRNAEPIAGWRHGRADPRRSALRRPPCSWTNTSVKSRITFEDSGGRGGSTPREAARWPSTVVLLMEYRNWRAGGPWSRAARTFYHDNCRVSTYWRRLGWRCPSSAKGSSNVPGRGVAHGEFCRHGQRR